MDSKWLALALPIVLTAIIGAIGWFWKTTYDWREQRRQLRAERIASLQQLSTLLDTSRRVFEIQAKQRNRLLELLNKNHPDKVDTSAGYDAVFEKLYDEFTPEEKELHGVIRAMTVNAMRKINLDISDWLKGDDSFKTRAVSLTKQDDLSGQLRKLELHLALWHAKYQYWIPENLKHALVYLGDEKEHGIKFPTEVEEVVDEAIQDLQKK
jgi:hypothetical protein